MAQANSDLSSQTASSGVDPLASLYKMSTTAGLGSQDYVAVNVLSVVTLALGLASGLVLLDNILLIIPVVGVVIGILSLVQIRRSSGTQTGAAWAVIGLLLCLGLAGYKFGNEAVAAAKTYADESAIEQVVVDVGDFVKKPETTDKAYALFTDAFKARVSLDLFKSRWASFRSRELIGELTAIRSNGIVRVEVDPKTGTIQGVAGTISAYSKIPAGTGDRRNFFFIKDARGWRVEGIPDLFPDTSKQGGAPGE